MKQKVTRKRFKNERGVTLIALVVTIVILLILAGITINYVFSEGGLFDTAKNSGNTWQNAQNSDINALNDLNGMIGNLVNGTGSGGTTKPEDTTSVTGVKLNTNAVTLKVGGTAALATTTLTATVEPSDATNKNVTWSSSDSSVAEVSNSGTIIAKAIGTATITVTTEDRNKTASCIVTVSNATASLTDGCDIKLTEENYGAYLGRAVKYTPANPSTEYGTSTTYRIFYIDFAGKYGEKGAVYLKADCDGKYVGLSSYASHTSTDNYAIMDALNPSWTKPETMQTSDYCVSGILDQDVWKNWKDTTTVGIKDNINYVVGAPSLEMYVDSYNKYLDTHPGLKKNGGTDSAQKLACEYVTSGYNAKGYRIGFADVASASWENTGYYQNSNALISSLEANGMYNPGSEKYYWLSSPSADSGSNRVMRVVGADGRLGYNYYNHINAFCPLVSLKSSAQLELAN